MLPSLSPPPPLTPAYDLSQAKRHISRDHLLTVLRNNFIAVFAILFFNWFFPVYIYLKVLYVPASWLRMIHIIEISLLFVVFGSNIFIAFVSLCYSRPESTPEPAPKPPPAANSPTRSTPVRRPVKNLGTSKYYASSGSAFSESRPINDNSILPKDDGLRFSQSEGLSSSADLIDPLPLAAYRSRHPRRLSKPIGIELVEGFIAMAEDTKVYY